MKQRTFAENYITTGGNVYRSAVNAGYSENYAKTNAGKLLENDRVKSYIDERLAELESEKIVQREEILIFLTSVMRGEVDGVDCRGRLKAAEMLGRIFGLFNGKGMEEAAMGKIDIIIEAADQAAAIIDDV